MFDGKIERKSVEMKVKRNAPCICGSGKKYKHCCMNKETAITKEDWIEKCHYVHQQLIRYTEKLEKPYYKEWKEQFSNYGDIFDALYISWFVAKTAAIKESVVELFLKENLKNIDIFIRPMCKEWSKETLQIFEVNKVDEEFITLTSLTQEKEKIVDLKNINVNEGDFIIGTIYRIDDFYVFTQRYVVIPKEQISNFKHKIKAQPELFSLATKENFEQFLTFIFTGLNGFVDQNLWVFDSNKEEAVAHDIQEFIKEESLEVSPDYALKVWKGYVSKYEPIIRKPEVFSAALAYIFMQTKNPNITKKEIASRFEISTSALSKRINEIDEYMLFELHTFMKNGESFIFNGENVKDELESVYAKIEK